MKRMKIEWDDNMEILWSLQDVENIYSLFIVTWLRDYVLYEASQRKTRLYWNHDLPFCEEDS